MTNLPCFSAPITGFSCDASSLCAGYSLIGTYTICRANEKTRKDKDTFSMDASINFPPGIDLTKTEGFSIGWMAENFDGTDEAGTGYEFMQNAKGQVLSRSMSFNTDIEDVMAQPWTAFTTAIND